MKRFLAILLLLGLTSCATIKNIETALTLGTATTANPVTPTRLNQMESGVILVFAGLRTWKSSCVQGLIPPVCRAQIATVQAYTRQIPPYLKDLRNFVKNNDQVGATIIWNTLINVIDEVKTQAAAGGVTISTGAP